MNLLLIISTLSLGFTCAHNIQAIAGLIKAFQNGCVYIVHSENASLNSSSNAIRALSDEGVAVSASDVGDWLRQHEHLQCEHHRPFYVLLDPMQVRQAVVEDRAFEAQWLLVLPVNAHGQTESEALSGILVNVDCLFFVARATPEGGFHLYEVYRLAKGKPLIRRRYGYWTRENGLHRITSRGLYERRADLQGITIKAVTLQDATNTELEILHNKTILKSGFFGNVWKILENKLNFKTEFSVVSNLTWLSDENQTVLSNDDTQVAVISIAMKSNRVNIVQYTFPLYGNKLWFSLTLSLMCARYHLFIREPSARQLVWTSIFAPFEKEVWIAIVACTLTFTLCVCLVIQFFNRHQLVHETLTNADSVTYLFGAICCQGFEPSNSLNTIRLIFFFANFLGVIIVASYSADIISDLSQIKAKIPFRGIEGLVKDGTFQLGTHQRTTALLPEFDIKNSSWQRVYQKVLYREYRANVPKTEPEALARICKKHYAYFSHVYKILPYINDIRPCRLMKLPWFVKVKLGIVFAKGSPYYSLINYYIKRLRMSGHLRKLRTTGLSNSLNDDAKSFVSLNMETAAPILTIILGGVVCTCILLISELCFQRKIFTNANVINSSKLQEEQEQEEGGSGSARGTGIQIIDGE